MASIAPYFQKTGDSFIFKGKKLLVKIPRRYETRNLLQVGEDVTTLAVFEMVIDDKVTCGFFLPALITMFPSKTYTGTEDGVDLLYAEFVQGDKFIANRTVLKRNYIAYQMFVEFITLGNFPKFITYEHVLKIFGRCKDICDADLRTDSSVFELIYSHLARDPDNLNIKYRMSNMKKPAKFIALSSVTYGADSTSAKLIGAYMSDGINSAIVNQSTEHSQLEDLLRT